MSRFVRALFVCAFMGTISLLAGAQTTDGSIYGAITDPSGAAIPGAKIVITDVATGTTTQDVSNGKGEYLFPTVEPGDYTVKVMAAGFKAQTQTGVTVQANSNIHVPVAMAIGAETDTVSVEAGVTLVDTREAQVAATLDTAQVENLPTENHDAYSLLTTIPGVSNFSGDGITSTRNGTTFSVNGLPATESSFYLDGAYDTNFYGPGGNKAPSPDMLDQFHVITSNTDAEFGRTPGAVVNMISKRGTNEYHGTLYDYWRNDAVDAKGFFNTGIKPILRQNQFGAAVGGRIPGLKDKMFFFGSYEQAIIHQTTTVNTQQTPTAAERTGDFRAVDNREPAGFTIPAADSTACGSPAMVICPSKLDPVAQALLAYVPVFNYANGTTPTETNITDNSNFEGLGRLDWHGFAKHSMYGTYFRSQGLVLDPGAGGNGGIGIPGSLPQYSGMRELENQQNAIIADDWTISDRTVNSIRGFYTDNRYIISNQLGNGVNYANAFGSGQPQGSDITSPTYYTVTGDFTLGPSGAGPSDINQISFGLIDTATLQLGHHAVKVGASWASNKYSEDGKGNSNGQYTFNGSGLTTYPLANFLLGSATTLVQNSGVHHRYRQQDPAAFVQDDWQITPRFNLNLGVRWELDQPWLDENDEINVQEGVQSTVLPGAPLGLLVPGDKGLSDGGFKTAWDRFAPRVGFAYDVFGDGKTSLRSAFGIFWDQIALGTVDQQEQEPFTIAQQTNGVTSLQCPYGGTYTGGTCAGATTPFPFKYNSANPRFYTNTTLSAIRPGEKSDPYAEEWNLQIQQQLGKQVALTLGYVGMNYMKQFIALDINTPQFFSGAPVSENPFVANSNGLNCRRPYEPYRVGGIVDNATCTFLTAPNGGYSDAQGLPLQFGMINEQFPANNNHYNSLLAQINGHMKSLDFNANYVWSKTLNFTTPTVNQANLRYNYGPAGVDLRNRLAFSETYRLPSVHMFGFVGTEVLSGWHLNDITILQSGGETTVMANVDVNRDGTTNDRVNVVGPELTGAKGHVNQVYGAGWLVASSYQQPCGATVNATCTNPYGNEQRNSIPLPANFQNNISAFKDFALPHKFVFQFRAEAFNAFNYTHLTSIRNNLTVFPTAVNKFQTADAGRVLQFAGRITF